jgi:hypothetical protein
VIVAARELGKQSNKMVPMYSAMGIEYTLLGMRRSQEGRLNLREGMTFEQCVIIIRSSLSRVATAAEKSGSAGTGKGSDQIRLIIFRIHVYYYVKAGKERPVAVSEAGNTEVSAIRYRLRDAKTS